MGLVVKAMAKHRRKVVKCDEGDAHQLPVPLGMFRLPLVYLLPASEGAKPSKGKPSKGAPLNTVKPKAVKPVPIPSFLNPKSQDLGFRDRSRVITQEPEFDPSDGVLVDST